MPEKSSFSLTRRRLILLVGGGALLVGAGIWLHRAVQRGGRLVRPVVPTDYIREPEVPALVVRRGEDSWEVCWSQPTGRVSVHVGAHPDQIDWQTALAVVDGHGSLQLTGRDPRQREYYGLQFADGDRLVVAERSLPLQGNGNFRDLGGYLTVEGRMTRWGRVYRSGTLARLTEEDQNYLAEIGLRIICDFRSEMEMARDPDRLPAGVEYRPMSIVNDNPITTALNTILFRRHQLSNLMQQGYFHLVDDCAADYGRLLALLADENNLPLVFHCAAGKDRAGIAAALILKLLGVPDATILADYSLSNHIFEFQTREFADEMAPFTRLGIPIEQLYYPLLADPAWLATILAHIDQHYGGINAYLSGPAGLSLDDLAAIRRNLLN